LRLQLHNQPLSAHAHDCRIKRIEGRKLFLEAELSDQPLVKSGEATETKGGAASTIQTCGKVYARGNALFIIPRQVSKRQACIGLQVKAPPVCQL
jgi:hypothetical protein